MTWSASQYTKFETERTRPARDLIAQILNENVAAAVDIGCGPGNSTELLRARFPAADILGIDGSPDMIAAARARMPQTRFEVHDILTWKDSDKSFDVMTANAVLQWISDHARLLPALLRKLRPGGSLAVQIPDNLDEPAHRLMREIAAAPRWAGKLGDSAKARAARHDADWYYRTLRQSGAEVDVWRTTYHHVLSGAPALVEWFKGTGLRPFLDPLEPEERAAFLTRYEAALALAYPALSDGRVLLPFPRLFFVATI